MGRRSLALLLPQTLTTAPARQLQTTLLGRMCWVAGTLSLHSIGAPPGFAYLGHPLRSCASSAIETIRVFPVRLLIGSADGRRLPPRERSIISIPP